MLIFEKRETVVYTPPRCGSSTVLNYGISIGEVIQISGPDRVGEAWGHYARSFKEFEHFKQVVIIRRPLERLCSLFRLHRKHETSVKWADYIDKLIDGGFSDYPIHDNQDTFLRNIKEDHIIYVDDGIDAGLRKLGLMPKGYKMERRNTSPPRDFPNPENISNDHIEKFRHWWEPDCKRFKVEMR